jgi:hypothetical protein
MRLNWIWGKNIGNQVMKVMKIDAARVLNNLIAVNTYFNSMRKRSND